MKKLILTLAILFGLSGYAFADFEYCTASQNLVSAALSKTCDFSTKAGDIYNQFPKEVKVKQILIKASTSISETVTITFDSAEGSSYDTVLVTQALSSASSFVFRPDGDLLLANGDQIKVQVTNANTTGIVYLTVQVEREKL